MENNSFKNGFKETTLHNGLKIITDSNSNDSTTTISFAVKVGCYNEDESNLGIAHFTEHMLFKGTTNRTAQDINEDIGEVGGLLNASTSFEVTQYFCTISSDFWQKAVEVLSDLIWNNTIPEEEFDLERSVILEELKMYDDDPQSKCMNLLLENMHENAINRQTIGGTLESVSKITRQQMLDFIDKFYTPNNIFIVATGNINHEELVKEVEKYTNQVEIKNSDIKEESYQYEKLGKVIEKNMNIVQSHLSFGLFGPKPNSEEYPVAELTSIILGGNSNSRLYRLIREEKGLAYTVSVSNEEVKDNIIINGYVGLDGSNIELVKNIIIEQLNNLKESLVSEKELNMAKAYKKGASVISRERTSNRTAYIIYSLIVNSNPSFEHELELVEKVTPEQIKDFANKYLTEDNLCFVELKPSK